MTKYSLLHPFYAGVQIDWRDEVRHCILSAVKPSHLFHLAMIPFRRAIYLLARPNINYGAKRSSCQTIVPSSVDNEPALLFFE
jgi:hypothetical protein